MSFFYLLSKAAHKSLIYKKYFSKIYVQKHRSCNISFEIPFLIKSANNNNFNSDWQYTNKTLSKSHRI